MQKCSSFDIRVSRWIGYTRLQNKQEGLVDVDVVNGIRPALYFWLLFSKTMS